MGAGLSLSLFLSVAAAAAVVCVSPILVLLLNLHAILAVVELVQAGSGGFCFIVSSNRFALSGWHSQGNPRRQVCDFRIQISNGTATSN